MWLPVILIVPSAGHNPLVLSDVCSLQRYNLLLWYKPCILTVLTKTTTVETFVSFALVQAWLTVHTARPYVVMGVNVYMNKTSVIPILTVMMEVMKMVVQVRFMDNPLL